VKNLIGENIDYLMVDDCIQFVFMIRWRLVTWMNENREQITIVPRNNLTPHLAAFCFQNTHVFHPLCPHGPHPTWRVPCPACKTPVSCVQVSCICSACIYLLAILHNQ
jgi:hypothetical protein